MIITVAETSNRNGRFRATAEDGTELVKSSGTPLLSSARVLLARGTDPNTPLVMRHADSPHDALTSTVGAAAKLIVEDNSLGKPIFRRWRDRQETSGTASPSAQNAQQAPRQPPAPDFLLHGDPAQPVFKIAA